MHDRWIDFVFWEIGKDKWLFDHHFTIARTATATAHSWSDGNGAFFSISRTVFPHPPHKFPSPDSPMVHSSTQPDTEGRWRMGGAYISVVPLGHLDPPREHVAMEFARGIQPRSFDVPEVVFFGDWAGRYHLITRKLPGMTLDRLWTSMDKAARSRIEDRIVQACKEMATKTGFFMTAVDGRWLTDTLFDSGSGDATHDRHPQNMLRVCKEMGMDCSELVFSHSYITPGSIIVDPEKDTFGIAYWRAAGYIPKGYVRSQFELLGFLLRWPDARSNQNRDPDEEYVRDMQDKLGKAGFRPFTKAMDSRLEKAREL